jgi:hypothetical protein
LKSLWRHAAGNKQSARINGSSRSIRPANQPAKKPASNEDECNENNDVWQS